MGGIVMATPGRTIDRHRDEAEMNRFAAAPATMAWPAALLGALGVAALQLLLAYRASPAVALVAVVAVAGTVAIAFRPILGVYAAFLAVPLEFFSVRVGGSFGLSASEGLFVLTAAMIAPRLLLDQGGGAGARVASVYIPYAGLLMLTALGVLVAVDSFVVIKILVMWSAFGVISLHLASRAREREVVLALACLAFAGGVSGAVALSGMADQEVIAGGTIVSNRAQAGFQHPAVLAFFLLMAFPPALALGLRGPRALRPAMLAFGVLAALGLVLSLTRGAIIGAFVALVVLMIWRPFRRAAIVLLAAGAIFVTFNAGALERTREVSVVGTRLSTIFDEQANRSNPRIKIWQTTPQIVAEHPFLGIGQGNFASVSPGYGLYDVGSLPYNHAHDLFLNVAVELGVFGLGMLVWFLVAVGRAIGAIIRARARPTFPIGVGLAAALSGLLASSILDYPPRTNVIMAAIMVQVGALVALERTAGERADG
jgi:putative inorganic carbon (hco3(-)) transporter